MLDMGFFPDIMWVVERMTGREQTLLFSATFPQEIIDAAHEFMNEPDFVLTNAEELDIPPIDLFSVRIGRSNKLWVLGRLLARMDDADQTIIFCNTKRMVDLAVERLKKHRFDVAGLHGDLSQNQRERILNAFKEGDVKTIIATDVAARGIDVDGITLVINYDIPNDMDSFIHRIGRTGESVAPVRHGASSQGTMNLNSRRSWPPTASTFNQAKHLSCPTAWTETLFVVRKTSAKPLTCSATSDETLLSPEEAGSPLNVANWFLEQFAATNSPSEPFVSTMSRPT